MPFDTVEPTEPDCVSVIGAETELVLLQMLPWQHCQLRSLDIVTLRTPSPSIAADTAITYCRGVSWYVRPPP
jgi:hypothetical protein